MHELFSLTDFCSRWNSHLQYHQQYLGRTFALSLRNDALGHRKSTIYNGFEITRTTKVSPYSTPNTGHSVIAARERKYSRRLLDVRFRIYGISSTCTILINNQYSSYFGEYKNIERNP